MRALHGHLSLHARIQHVTAWPQAAQQKRLLDYDAVNFVLALLLYK